MKFKEKDIVFENYANRLYQVIKYESRFVTIRSLGYNRKPFFVSKKMLNSACKKAPRLSLLFYWDNYEI